MPTTQGPVKALALPHGRATEQATAKATPAAPEGVKKLRTGGDREGGAPAEPHGARTCWGDGSPGGSPSQFFHTFPPGGGELFEGSGKAEVWDSRKHAERLMKNRTDQRPTWKLHCEPEKKGEREGQTY